MSLWQVTSEGVRKDVFPYKLHPELVQVSEKSPIGFNGSAKNRKGQSYPLLSGGAQHDCVGPQGISLISASQHTCPALEEPDLPWKARRSWREFSYWTCCSGRDGVRDKRREKRRWARRRVLVYFLAKPALCLVCISVSSSGVSTAGLWSQLYSLQITNKCEQP